MSKLGKVFITSGIILILFSFSLLIIYNVEDYKAKDASLKILKAIEEEREIASNIENLNSNDTKKQTLTIDGNDYLGTINIPALNLNLPILNDFSYDKLKIAPCRYYGSLLTNNLIICGHSYKSHFAYLGNLKQNDLIIITDASNNNYFYEVLEVEILGSTDVEEMINNDFELTLYTCTSDSQKRVTIRCNRIYKSFE